MFPNFLEGPFLFLSAVVLICTTGLLPACMLLKGEAVWAASPFLGIATALLVLGNLLHLDVRIGTSAIPLALGAVAAVAVAIWWRIVPPVPRRLVTLALLVGVVAGFGFFSLGRHYTAFQWTDQYTNISTAQFLMDKPFSTDDADVKNTPYLLTPIGSKPFRIGAQVVIAYIASTLGTNAKAVYGSVSVLTTILVFLAIWMGAGRLGLSGWRRAAAALFAALLPGFAVIPLECFLPQALATCFLLFWPVVVDLLLATPSVKMILFSALFLVAPLYVYPEFFPLFALFALPAGLWQSIKSRWPRPALASILALAIPLLANPHATQVAWRHVSGSAMSNVLSGIYPFALKLEGIQRIWFGGLFYTRSGWAVMTADALAVFLVLVAIVGLISAVMRSKSTYSVGMVVILALPLFPLLASLRSPVPYQFYKILLSTTPVWALGATILLTGTFQHRMLSSFRLCLFFIFFALSIVATLGLVHKTITGGTRTNFDLTLRAHQNFFYDKLEHLRDKNVLYVPASGGLRPDSQSFYALDIAYVTYHARRARLWMLTHSLDHYLTAPYPRDYTPTLLAGDIDGDRKADLVLFNAESGHWFVLRASRHFDGLEEWAGGLGVQPYNFEIALLADVDGDGKADAIIFNPMTGWWVALSNGQHFETPRKWDREVQPPLQGRIPFIADVNGDGKADAIIFNPMTGWWVALSNGTQFLPFTSWSRGPMPRGRPLLGDINGDGKADAILAGDDGGWWCLSSDGHRLLNAVPWRSAGGPLVTGNQIVLTDINGDRRAEAVLFDAKTREIWSAVLHDGAGFSWTREASVPAPWPFAFLDTSKMPRDTILMEGPPRPNEPRDRVTLSADLSGGITTAFYYTGGRYQGADGAIHYRLGDQYPRLSLFLHSSFDQSRPVIIGFRVERNSTTAEGCVALRVIIGPEALLIRNVPMGLADGHVEFPLLISKGLTSLTIESPLRQPWQAPLTISDVSIRSARAAHEP